jgi:hypothetical protein
MDKNANLHDAAWHLVYASSLVKKYKKEMADDLLKKADELSKEIDVNMEEVKEIEAYEQQLREAP